MPERIRILESVMIMIKNIKTQIMFVKTPLEQLLEFLESNKDLRKLTFITDTLNELNSGKTFQASWNDSVDCFAKNTPLNKDEVSLIRSFADGLGVSDVNGQISNCDTYAELLKMKISTLKDKSENTYRLYNSLGVLTGVLLAVILY